MNRSEGFSLVEVMCAILILGIGLVGLTRGITTALSSSKESEVQTTAVLLASGRIETLRADGYLAAGIKEGEWGQGLSSYRWKQSITSTTIDGLYEVEVAVENSKSGKSICTLTTLLFDPPASSTFDQSRERSNPAKSKKRDRSRL